MDSPCTPQGQGLASRSLQEGADVLQEHPINAMAEQLQRAVTISRPAHKREQTAQTPASQARPRTQRRTMGAAGQAVDTADTAAQDQENRLGTGAGQAVAAAEPQQQQQQGVTPSRLTCISALRDELSCGICLEICVRPCATPCGHNFCRTCLRLALQHKRQCPHCRDVLPPPSRWRPKINTALWNTIQLLFPQHAAEAPPPTPPGATQPAAAGRAAATAAAGSSRRQPAGAADGLQDWLGWPVEASRATRASSQLHHRMADAVAGVRSGMDAAARQPFRPPRRQQASQQQQPVLEDELLTMLQGMRSTAWSAQRSTQQQGSTAGRQQQQQPSQRGRSTQRQHMQQRQEVILLDDDDDEEVEQEQQAPTSRTRATAAAAGAAAGRSSRRVAGRASSLPRRTGRSAAPARGADSDAFHLRFQDLQDADEALLQEVIQLSMVPHQAAARDAQAAAAAGSGRVSRRQQQPQHMPQQQQPQQQLADELDVLFGRIHSGSSPRHFWSDASVEEPDWLLMEGAADPQQQAQQEQPTAARAHQGGSNSSGGSGAAAGARMGAWMQSRAAAAGARRQRLRPIASAAGAARATAASDDGTALSDVATLQEMISDEFEELEDAIDALRAEDAAAFEAAVAAVWSSPAGGRGSSSRILDADLRSVLLSSEDEGPGGSSTGPGGRLQSAAGAAAQQPWQIAAVCPGDSARRAGGPAAAGTGARGGTQQQQQQLDDVLALTLADSPEPQPLLSRLARVTAGQPAQHQQQQQQQQGQGVAASRGQSSAGSGSSSQRLPGAGSDVQGAIGEVPAAAAAAAAGRQRDPGNASGFGSEVEDEEDDDFQPRGSSARSRGLNALRASSAIAAAAGVAVGGRRVIAGMRAPGVTGAQRRASARSRAL